VRRGVPRWTSALAVHLLLLAVSLVFLLLVLPLVLEQGAAFLARLPDLYLGGREQLLSSSTGALRRLVDHFPVTLPNEVPSTAGRPLDALSGLSGVKGLGHTLFLVASTVALGFYWTVEGEAALRTLLQLVPGERREGLRAFLVAAQDKMGRYVWGQGLVCLAVGTLSLGAYAALGLPHALVLALIAGVLDAIPLLGPVLGMLPALCLAAAIQPSLGLWVLLSYFVIHTIETYVLAPRVMGQTVGVNPLVTLLSISAFGSLLGLAGVFLAIPIAAVLQLVLEGLIRRQRADSAAGKAGLGSVGLLRAESGLLVAEVQRLVQHDDGGVREDPNELESAVEALARDLDRVLAESVALREMGS
jgi:predicted PurR-regulated permease PerM